MKRLGYIAIIILLSAPPAVPQGVLTLEDCIAIALANNAQINNARSNLNISRGDRLGSYSGILPTLTLSAGPNRFYRAPAQFTDFTPVGLDPESGKVIQEKRTITSEASTTIDYNVRFEVRQNFWDQGKWWNRIRQSNANVRASEYNVNYLTLTTIANVKVRYYELVKALEQLKVRQESVRLAEAQLHKSQVMYEIGTVAQIDIFRSKATLDANKISMIDQTLAVENAKNSLNLIMGRNISTPLEIDTNIPLEVPFDLSLESLTSRAVRNSPSIKQIEENIKSSAFGLKVAKSDRYPKLGYSVSYSRRNSEFEPIYNNLALNYTLNLNFTISYNLFDGFQTKSAIERNQNTLRIQETNLDEQIRTTKSTVKQLYEQLVAYRRKIEINKDMIEASEEDLRLATERYSLGTGTLLETITAQEQLTKSRYSLLEQQYNALIAAANLEAEVGSLE